jgi:ABC-type transport system substrate-binding protein
MRTTKRTRTLALLGAVAFVAAACGSSKSSSGTTTSAASSSTAASTSSSAAASSTSAAASSSSSASSSFKALAYDESAKCGQKGVYEGNIAKIEAVDENTVKFTMCQPDVAFPSKVAFASFAVSPAAYLDKAGTTQGGDLTNKPIGTGPYVLKAWEKGNQIVLERNDNYWGTKPAVKTVTVRWQKDAAQRLVDLQSGQADGIDNVGTDDFAKIKADTSLQLVDRPATNVFYLGMNDTIKPFDNEKVREAVGYAIDKQKIVDNFYPKGSTVASQFLPAAIPGYTKGFTDFTYDVAKAKQLLTDAGLPNGFSVKLSYRDVVRGYLPQPTPIATEIQSELAKVGIKVELDVQESTTLLDNAAAGKLPFHLLGWGADYPDATNFLDYHFGKGASPQFGTGFSDIQDLLTQAGALSDQTQRDALYAKANALIAQHAPLIPIANGGSGVAYKADVKGAQASPFGDELFAAINNGKDQFNWLQNGEPGGLYCADETDGESLRVCAQINESLLAYEVNGTKVVPSLADKYEADSTLKEWTFHLHPGVKFSDGTAMTANDVVRSWRVQWDAKDPAHKGRTGDFNYFSSLFGGFLNPPPKS